MAPRKASPNATHYKSVTGKTQITIRLTESMAQDLNLILATHGLHDVSYVVRESVAVQATAIRKRMATSEPVGRERTTQGKPPCIEKGETDE